MTFEERLDLKRAIDAVRREHLTRVSAHEPNCLACGDPLPTDARAYQKYCSDRCRKRVGSQSGWRQRSEELQPLGQLLLDARNAAGLTQRQLCRKLGINRETWRSWEQGRTSPAPDRRAVVEKHLGISAAVIAELSRKRGPTPIGGVEAVGTASAARATLRNQSERLTSQKTAARSDAQEVTTNAA